MVKYFYNVLYYLSIFDKYPVLFIRYNLSESITVITVDFGQSILIFCEVGEGESADESP